MATFGEMIYAVLDLLKERSNDAYYTEEHALFFLKKIRATLLERKYKGSRNGTFSSMSPENRQQVCLSLGPATDIPACANCKWLVSNEKVPTLINEDEGVTCTGHDLIQTTVTFIPRERMPYVGYNKWLRNIIYAARSMDGRLYLSGMSSQMLFLDHVGLTGVFSDPEEAAKMSHEACVNGGCDIMSQTFPLEAALVPSCIELTVQELSGARFAPEDKQNNAKDNLSDVVARQAPASPVESSQDNRRNG